MITRALFARFEAKPGKEAVVEELLQQGLALANQEAGTPIWLALRISPLVFGVFDAFASDTQRQEHLAGPIAAALMGRTEELFVRPPEVELIDVLGIKNSAAGT